MATPPYIGAASWRGGSGNREGPSWGPTVPERSWCDRVASWFSEDAPVYSGGAAKPTARRRCGSPTYATGPQSASVRLVTATPAAIVVGRP